MRNKDIISVFSLGQGATGNFDKKRFAQYSFISFKKFIVTLSSSVKIVS